MTDQDLTAPEAVGRRKVSLPQVPKDNEQELVFAEGVTYAIQIVAESLGIHPDEFSWDTATEEFEGDVRSIVGNMLSVISDDPATLRGVGAPGEIDVEYLAFRLWRHEAERAAPNVAKQRTLQTFADQSPETVQIWMGFASAAIHALKKGPTP